jgi:uncharacterized protein YfaS (alpha-2-macroglobulin family)
VAAIAAVVLVGGAATGFYIHDRAAQTSSGIPAAARPSAPPPVSVGAKTVEKTAAAVFLTVASTSPGANASGVPLNAPILITFNLPVDPEPVGRSANILPNIPGTWSQGSSDATVQFTPSSSFSAGASVSVVIHAGLASRDGFTLQSDFQLSFITQVGSDGVLFQAGYNVAKLLNVQSGHSADITLQTGDQVPSDIAIQTYKVTINDLLSGLVYDSNGAYSTQPIDTSHFQLLDTKSPVQNNTKFTLTEPDGVYLVIAADPAGQYGSMWLDVSKYGVLLRQDDQRIVVAGEDLTTGNTAPTLGITFYTLKGKVVGTTQASFSGTAEFPAKFPSGYDVAVAVNGDEVVVVPMNAPATDADIKVTQDLGQHPQIYITTDRAAYVKGDTVKFAGVARVSNDQQYAIPANSSVEVWMPGSPNDLVDLKVPVSAGGTFSGSFAIPASAFNADGSDNLQELYASIVGAPQIYPLSETQLVALGPHTPTTKLSVTFDKPDYVSSGTITATITGVNNSGTPLAGATVAVTIYSADHPVAPHEMDAFPTPNTWGTPVKDTFGVHLDANGKATYAFAANIAGRSADQQVTLEATYAGGSAQSVSAKTVVVYQAADEIFLLPSRSVYAVGDQVVAPFVVETRAGDRIPNVTMSYELDHTTYQGSTSTTTVIQGGTINTDSNGIGVVRVTYTGVADGITLKVKGNDAAGNTFQDSTWLNITQDASGLVGFNGIDTLVQLGVTQDKIAYSVGDTANFTVTAPANENVLLSLERGRIHMYKWLTLKQGDNPLAVNVTPDLAPGFTIMFSYFRNGAYLSEGLPVAINNSDRLLKVTVAADQTSYTAGQTAHLTVTVTDSSGKPVAASLLADGYDAIMSQYKLVDQGSIGGSFLRPGLRATNGSSSLLGIGNWGGRCGGGGGPGDQLAVTLAGHSELWSAGVATDATTGQLTLTVPMATSTVRVVIVASTSATSVGQAELDLSVG